MVNHRHIVVPDAVLLFSTVGIMSIHLTPSSARVTQRVWFPGWASSLSFPTKFLLFHVQTSKRLRHMVIVGIRRLPCDAFAVGWRALEAEKVDAQILAGAHGSP